MNTIKTLNDSHLKVLPSVNEFCAEVVERCATETEGTRIVNSDNTLQKSLGTMAIQHESSTLALNRKY